MYECMRPCVCVCVYVCPREGSLAYNRVIVSVYIYLCVYVCLYTLCLCIYTCVCTCVSIHVCSGFYLYPCEIAEISSISLMRAQVKFVRVGTLARARARERGREAGKQKLFPNPGSLNLIP
jgi:hypothetical protein